MRGGKPAARVPGGSTQSCWASGESGRSGRCESGVSPPQGGGWGRGGALGRDGRLGVASADLGATVLHPRSATPNEISRKITRVGHPQDSMPLARASRYDMRLAQVNFTVFFLFPSVRIDLLTPPARNHRGRIGCCVTPRPHSTHRSSLSQCVPLGNGSLRPLHGTCAGAVVVWLTRRGWSPPPRCSHSCRWSLLSPPPRRRRRWPRRSPPRGARRHGRRRRR